MEDRRAHERLDSLEGIIGTHLKEHSTFEIALQETTELTRKIVSNTDELVELLKVFQQTRGFIATLRTLGKVLLWIASVGGAIVVIGIGIKSWLLGLK